MTNSWSLRALGCAVSVCAGLLAGQARAGCGTASEACSMDSGRYHIVLPPPDEANNAGTAAPVVMVLHGYGGSGAGVLKMRTMVDGLTQRGYAVIAPTAERRNGGNRIWVFYPGWEGRDDAAFLRDVVADAANRFNVSDTRVLLSGFSAGAFMVNYLACATPEAYPAYAPVSGGFWRPMPTSCKGPVRLFHTHGWRDGVVPLEGRKLSNGKFEQGDIFAGLEIWRDANGCDGHKPGRTGQSGSFLYRSWNECAPGAALQLALFPGGHQVPKGWADLVLDWFETQVPDDDTDR
ncbi:alpha/beta hydrolase family esterase [Aliisedimentitalea scapharcae]